MNDEQTNEPTGERPYRIFRWSLRMFVKNKRMNFEVAPTPVCSGGRKQLKRYILRGEAETAGEEEEEEEEKRQVLSAGGGRGRGTLRIKRQNLGDFFRKYHLSKIRLYGGFQLFFFPNPICIKFFSSKKRNSFATSFSSRRSRVPFFCTEQKKEKGIK